MSSFLRNHIFSRKNASKLVLVSIIAVILFLFRDYLFTNSEFHIQSKQQMFEIHEKGKISYPSGKVVEIKNEYSTEEKISRDGSVITVHGRIDGNIDPVLTPIFNSRNYFTEIDLSDIDCACSAGFNPIYPVAVRRLVYFIPETELFDGQVREINTCKGKLSCIYTLKFIDKKAFAELLCSGSMGDSEVAVSGIIGINKKLSGFDSINLEITASAPELVSSWTISDTKK